MAKRTLSLDPHCVQTSQPLYTHSHHVFSVRTACSVRSRLSPGQPSTIAPRSTKFPADNGLATPAQSIVLFPCVRLNPRHIFRPSDRAVRAYGPSRCQSSEETRVVRPSVRSSVALFSDSAQPIHAPPIVGGDLFGSLPESVHGRQLSLQAAINHVDPAQLVPSPSSVGPRADRYTASSQRLPLLTYAAPIARPRKVTVYSKREYWP